MQKGITSTPEPIGETSLLKLTDMILEWCQLNNVPLDDLMSNRTLILSRFRSGETQPETLFGDL